MTSKTTKERKANSFYFENQDKTEKYHLENKNIYIHIYFPNDSSVLFAVLFCFVVLGFEHRAFYFQQQQQR